MTSPIKSIEVTGLLVDCKDNCNHFCIIEYINGTHHTVKISGDLLVRQYWEYLTEQSKKHFEKIYEKYYLKSFHIMSLCLESYPCQHECILTYNNIMGGERVTKTLKGDYIANEYWDYLTEAGKIHFGKFKKNIDYSKLSKEDNIN